MGGPEVRPLAEVRFAEDHDTRGSQPRHHERVLRGMRSIERERPRGGHHSIARVDVVLDENRNPVERAAGALLRALRVEGVSDGDRVGIDLDDRMERRATAIDFFDAIELHLRNLVSGIAAAGHPFLKLRRGRLFKRKRWLTTRLHQQRDDGERQQ